MKTRKLVALNYGALLLLNVMFYLAWITDPSKIVDVVGMLCIPVVGLTFRPLFLKSGIWKLTHAKQDDLDEREIKVTQSALSESYGWFSVICLLIMLVQSIVSRMNICPKFTITVPLVASLIYFAHTLPGAFIAWRERS